MPPAQQQHLPFETPLKKFDHGFNPAIEGTSAAFSEQVFQQQSQNVKVLPQKRKAFIVPVKAEDDDENEFEIIRQI